jgi:RNA polymerase sigma-70 factor (ECF subfamily)
MGAAHGGQGAAYNQLLRELDAWLNRYYARRLPYAVAEDAKQDALLAIHVKRNSYSPLRPFGPWVAAIARHKWVDHVRDASRFAALQFCEEKTTVEDSGEPTLSSIVLDNLLSQLPPAQARVIRLVKLHGASIEDASGASGQSVALVKVNIHRGMKKLGALVARDLAATTSAAKPSMHQPATA